MNFKTFKRFPSLDPDSYLDYESLLIIYSTDEVVFLIENTTSLLLFVMDGRTLRVIEIFGTKNIWCTYNKVNLFLHKGHKKFFSFV